MQPFIFRKLRIPAVAACFYLQNYEASGSFAVEANESPGNVLLTLCNDTVFEHIQVHVGVQTTDKSFNRCETCSSAPYKPVSIVITRSGVVAIVQSLPLPGLQQM